MWQVFFFGALCAFITGSSARITFDGVSSDIYNNIFIYLMQGPEVTYDIKIPLEDGLTIKDHSIFDRSRETVFYFHGWTQGANGTSSWTIASAYLERGLDNVAVFDYSYLVQGDITVDYVGAAINAWCIGTAIGQFLKEFTTSVQDKSLLHLLAHSLGCQIMSKAATEYGAGQLPWLTAYLERGLDNVAVFDYSYLVQGDITVDYVGAAINAWCIGTAIGQFLKEFTTSVQDKSLLHLLAHSLGCQIMSKAATEYGAGQLPWLTGLDPAGPLFNLPLSWHLDATDAAFVDVIHTDGLAYGDARTIGTVDFFPNKGTRSQPFCENNASATDSDGCSHQMSWRYYASAIRNPTLFLAKHCTRTLCDINLALCSCTSERNYIGPNVNKALSGEFFLTTKNQPPFGQGEAGLQFGRDIS